MSSLAPGQRLEARCTRCRDVTGHVIVFMVDGKVAKVECCACGSVHKYYPPENKVKEAKPRPVRVQSGKERTDVVKAEARKAPRSVAAPKPKVPSRAEQQNARIRAELERQWREAIARNPATPTPYSMSAAFTLGALVDHPSFGVGMVMSVVPPDKMEVLFQEGVKALRCSC